MPIGTRGFLVDIAGHVSKTVDLEDLWWKEEDSRRDEQIRKF